MVRKVILYEANTLYFIPGDRENFCHTDGDVNPKSMLVVQGGRLVVQGGPPGGAGGAPPF